MRKWKPLVVSTIGAIAVALGFILVWRHDEPRRAAVQTLLAITSALSNPNPSQLLNAILLPAAARDRTPAEQQEFVTKALADELSAEGVLALKHHAEFGPLKLLFQNEATAWCKQAGVNIDDCVAFKMDHAGIRAEVVLVREGQNYRVVRCNNVKQMAMAERHA